MITEELINYPTAQLAKQAGFNALCKSVFTDRQDIVEEQQTAYGIAMSIDDCNRYTYLRPTQSLLQRWLREVCNYEVQVHYLPNIEVYCCTYTPKAVKPNTFKSVEKFKKHVSQYYSTKRHKTYELALEQALQEALTIIINRKDAYLS